MLALAGAALLTPRQANAQLTFTFSQPVQSVPAGGTIRFFATIANTGSEEIFLNGFNPGLTAPNITINDQFFANVPDVFQPGASGLYQVFSVVADANAAPGSYVGLAQVDYETPTLVNQRTTQAYTVNVTAVAAPEPSSLVGATLGLLSLGVVFPRYRKHGKSVAATPEVSPNQR